jgi:hypothetical protein
VTQMGSGAQQQDEFALWRLMLNEKAQLIHCVPRPWRQTVCPWTDVCRDVLADPVTMAAAQLGFPARTRGGHHVDRPFLPVPPRRNTPRHTTAHLAQPSAFCPAFLLGIYVLPNGRASTNPDFHCSAL